MNSDDLKAIEARANAATDGPWEYTDIPYNGNGASDDPVVSTAEGNYICQTAYDMQSKSRQHNVDADTIFIAQARSDVPALVAEVRRLKQELEDVYLRIGP